MSRVSRTTTEGVESFRVDRHMPRFEVERQGRLLDRDEDYRGKWLDPQGTTRYCGPDNHWHETKDGARTHAMQVWQSQSQS